MSCLSVSVFQLSCGGKRRLPPSDTHLRVQAQIEQISPCARIVAAKPGCGLIRVGPLLAPALRPFDVVPLFFKRLNCVANVVSALGTKVISEMYRIQAMGDMAQASFIETRARILQKLL